MRLSILLLASLFTISCGGGTSIDPTSPRFLYKGLKGLPGSHREANLQEVLDEFIREAANRGFDPRSEEPRLRVLGFHDGLSEGNMPPIKGTHAEGHAPAGICITAREVNPVNKKKIGVHHFVYFDASLKKSVGTPYFKAIAFHEFSHCLLGKKHGEALDLKGIRTPVQRMSDEMDARPDEVEAAVTPLERDEMYQRARYAYFDDIAAQHDIMAPGILHDPDFWAYKWDEMLEKLFAPAP